WNDGDGWVETCASALTMELLLRILCAGQTKSIKESWRFTPAGRNRIIGGSDHPMNQFAHQEDIYRQHNCVCKCVRWRSHCNIVDDFRGRQRRSRRFCPMARWPDLPMIRFTWGLRTKIAAEKKVFPHISTRWALC